MDHTNKKGESKILPACSLPLTGAGVVDRIITNLGVLDVVEGGLRLLKPRKACQKQNCARNEAKIVLA